MPSKSKSRRSGSKKRRSSSRRRSLHRYNPNRKVIRRSRRTCKPGVTISKGTREGEYQLINNVKTYCDQNVSYRDSHGYKLNFGTSCEVGGDWVRWFSRKITCARKFCLYAPHPSYSAEIEKAWPGKKLMLRVLSHEQRNLTDDAVAKMQSRAEGFASLGVGPKVVFNASCPDTKTGDKLYLLLLERLGPLATTTGRAKIADRQAVFLAALETLRKAHDAGWFINNLDSDNIMLNEQRNQVAFLDLDKAEQYTTLSMENAAKDVYDLLKAFDLRLQSTFKLAEAKRADTLNDLYGATKDSFIATNTFTVKK